MYVTSNSTSLARNTITARCTQGQVTELIRWYLSVMVMVSGWVTGRPPVLEATRPSGSLDRGALNEAAGTRDARTVHVIQETPREERVLAAAQGHLSHGAR